jgi:translation initiation factor 2 subunit 3
MKIDIEQIIKYQPTENINMLGHVSNGKSSLVETLTETSTQRYSSEKQRNLTIKLGYGNAKIFKCNSCDAPQCYQSFSSSKMEAYCKLCGNIMKLIKHISFVDSPGHNLLMQVMLNGTCVANSTIIVESVTNDIIPSQQTTEHINAANILNLKNALVCMNKVDLVSETILREKMSMLKKSLKGTIGEFSPIVPIVANYGINKDIVCEYLCTRIHEEIKDFDSDVKMIIIRSFNINKQNTQIKNMLGGVIGGSIIKGILKIGDMIEILPGIINTYNELKNKTTIGEKNKKNKKNKRKKKWLYTPLISRVESINSENNNLDIAIPGGLIGVRLLIDPCFVVRDRLIGNILHPIPENCKDNKYKIFEKIYVSLKLLDDNELQLIKQSDLVINHNGCDVKCKATKYKYHKNYKCNLIGLELLDRPICSEINDHVAISKVIVKGNTYMNDKDKIQLIGRGQILKGIQCIFNKNQI